MNEEKLSDFPYDSVEYWRELVYKMYEKEGNCVWENGKRITTIFIYDTYLWFSFRGLNSKKYIRKKYIMDVLKKETKHKCVRYVSESQVTIKFMLAPFSTDLIRVWKSTYLKPDNSDTVCKLVDKFNIEFPPKWTKVDRNKITWFTLVFEGLPKNCKTFDLFEDALEGRAFHFKDIARNETDIYIIPL
jgi:hypothetical protein